MKRLTLFFLAVLLAASWLFSMPGGSTPSHDARFLNLEIAYQLNGDGSWVKEYRHQVRLDTYFAVNRALGETFIVYNPEFQKLEVLKSETTMADGRKVPSPENAFNEVLPFPAHGFADFSHLREMVVTHTGLERGAVIELNYRLHTKAGFLPAFSGQEVLSRDFPVERYSLTVTIPLAQELNFRLFSLEAPVGLSSHEAEKTYVFGFRDLKPAAHEPLAHPQAEPFVVFSTAADWKQGLALAEAPSPLPALLAGKVDMLRARYPARPDLLAALHKLVAVEVKNCLLGTEATGWQARTPERVFAGNYGTRLEKALLLQALLKHAGIGADLMAVAGDAFAPKAPTALQIQEFWLKVPAEGTGDVSPFWYLDPCREQHEFFPYRFHGVEAYNLGRQELEKLPSSDGKQNRIEVSGKVSLGAAEASGTLRVTASGSFQNYGEATSDSGKFLAGLLKRIFPVDKVEVTKLLLLTAREIRAEVSFSGPWLKDVPLAGTVRAGDKFYTLNSMHLPGVTENMVLAVKRESPMLLDPPFQVSLQLELQPEAGLRLEYAGPETKRENEIGHFSRTLASGPSGLLRFSQEFSISRSVLVPERYPLLRELLLPYYAADPWLVFKIMKK